MADPNAGHGSLPRLPMLSQSLSHARRVSRLLVWIGGALLIGSALLVAVDVVLRRLFNWSLGGSDEISGYAFGIATALALAFSLLERAHIRVDAAYLVFPAWLRRVADILGMALFVGFVALVTVMAAGVALDSLEHGSRSITPLRTPLVLAQAPWLFGWAFCVACGALLLVTALVRLLRRDGAGADALIGAKSVSEQIEDETA